MCGIIAAFNYAEKKHQRVKTVNKWIIDQLEDQLHRGDQGFGSVFIDDKTKKLTLERSTEICKMLLDIRFNQSKMMMVHHRYPTSSENKISQTHPILVSDGSLKHNYLVVHNGVIHNSDDLREKHINELGFIYSTDRIKDKEETTEIEEYNDSETLAIEVARFIEGQTNKIEAVGSAAFICLRINKKTNKVNKLFFARNSNPLKMSKTRGKLRLSSEGEGDNIKENTMYFCDTTDYKLQQKPCIIDTWKSTSKIETGEYEHWAKGGKEGNYSNYQNEFGFNTDIDEKDEYEILNEGIEYLTSTAMKEIEVELEDTFDDFADIIIGDRQKDILELCKEKGDAIAKILVEAYDNIQMIKIQDLQEEAKRTETEKEIKKEMYNIEEEEEIIGDKENNPANDIINQVKKNVYDKSKVVLSK